MTNSNTARRLSTNSKTRPFSGFFAGDNIGKLVVRVSPADEE
jgi:hypothetical protein